jgi:N-acetyl-gamma-glutamyl-phosphate reductase
MKIKVGIIGATGYAGAELVRILVSHPQVQLVALTTQSYEGNLFYDVYPYLYKYVEQQCLELDVPALVSESDVIFAALPHGHAIPVAREALRQGKKFIDLGADFRFDSHEVYEQWYKVAHTAPELLKQAVYGLPEIHRDKIRSASLVGNPGCFPTSVILGLAPLLTNDLVDTGTVVADCKSGVSGAGRGLSLGVHFAEVNENFRAYNVGMHRHTPEIEQELGKLAGEEMVISFTPHLTPMNRGILSTIYAKLKQAMTLEQVRSIYEEYYRSEFFVRLLPPGMLPQTKAVAGSNHCDIVPVVDSRTGRVVVISAIDNLIKGAAGQAVQNMNLMYDLPETMGLDRPGLYP